MPNLVWLYLSLKGRITRSDYWMLYILPALVVGLASFWVASIYDKVDLVGDVVTLGFLWPSIAIQVKRWHDVDKSGWWVLINLIPVIGTIWALIENGFMSGAPGENRFGTRQRVHPLADPSQ